MIYIYIMIYIIYIMIYIYIHNDIYLYNMIYIIYNDIYIYISLYICISIYIYTVDYIPMNSPVQSTHHIAVLNPGFCGEIINYSISRSIPDLVQGLQGQICRLKSP